MGLTCLSPNDPNIAAAQLRRASDLGLRGAEMNVASANDPLYHKNWDALWEAADETGLPISFHTVGIAPRSPKPEEVEDYHWVLNGLVITMFQLAGAEYVSSIIYGGWRSIDTPTSSSFSASAASVGFHTSSSEWTMSTKGSCST